MSFQALTCGRRLLSAAVFLSLPTVCVPVQAQERPLPNPTLSAQSAFKTPTHLSLLTRLYAHGLSLLRVDRLDDARRVLRQGKELAEAHDEPPRLFEFEFVLGNIAMRQNHLDDAFSYYSEAEPLALASKDNRLIASVDLRLAKIYQMRKQTDKALDYYGRSLAALGDVQTAKFQVANAIYDRGNVYVDALRLDKAADDFNHALLLFQELSNKVWVAGCLTRLGYVSYGQGRLEQAEGYYTKSLAAWQEIGAKPQIANSEYYFGIVLRHEGKLDQALAVEQSALTILQGLNPANQDTADGLTALGQVYADRKEWERCIDYDSQALKIEPALDNRSGAAALDKALADAYTQSGQTDKAKDALAKSDNLAHLLPSIPPTSSGK